MRLTACLGVVCLAAAVFATEVTMVHCGTTVGDIQIAVHKEWSPLGAQRFLDLVDAGFYDGVALFRSIKGFLVQYGIQADPKRKFPAELTRTIPDDPSPGIEFEEGVMAFAGSGKNSRTTQIFISYSKNGLGKQPWETPFARVTQASLETVRAINSEYGDFARKGHEGGIDYGRLMREGSDYARKEFPRMTMMKTCRVVPDTPPPEPSTASATTEQSAEATTAMDAAVPEATSLRGAQPKGSALALVLVLGAAVALFLVSKHVKSDSKRL